MSGACTRTRRLSPHCCAEALTTAPRPRCFGSPIESVGPICTHLSGRGIRNRVGTPPRACAISLCVAMQPHKLRLEPIEVEGSGVHARCAQARQCGRWRHHEVGRQEADQRLPRRGRKFALHETVERSVERLLQLARLHILGGARGGAGGVTNARTRAATAASTPPNGSTASTEPCEPLAETPLLAVTMLQAAAPCIVGRKAPVALAWCAPGGHTCVRESVQSAGRAAVSIAAVARRRAHGPCFQQGDNVSYFARVLAFKGPRPSNKP